LEYALPRLPKWKKRLISSSGRTHGSASDAVVVPAVDVGAGACQGADVERDGASPLRLRAKVDAQQMVDGVLTLVDG
jgi:hypothetical protein